MSESYPKRREVAAEQYENTERFKANQYLISVGVFQKVNEANLYHGRAGNGKPWQVMSDLDNSGNKTGNRNVNKKPALSTSKEDIAKEFSEARVRGNQGSVPEVHKIESSDPDAIVINMYNIDNANKEELAKIREAFAQTTLEILDGSPLPFEHRNDLNNIEPRDLVDDDGFMMDIEEIQEKTGLDESIIWQVGTAINTRRAIEDGNIKQLCEAYLTNRDNILVQNKDIRMSLPINHEYLQRWFKKNHIAGYMLQVNSATLDYKTIDNNLLFNLEDINTPEVLNERERTRNRLFGRIANTLELKNENTGSPFIRKLNNNPYATPEDIIKLAKMTPGFEETFDGDSGNWEGFTLGEHTATTLRNFDKNWADILPASSLPLMRLALVVHDIGKGEANKAGEKENQMQYNIEYAKKFMKVNKVDEPTIKLVSSMISEGMDLATRKYVKGDNEARKRLPEYCKETLSEYLGTDDVDPGTIVGFRNMIEVLHLCDGGAYTTMSVTKANGVTYRNAGSFDSSFDKYHGIAGDRIRFKRRIDANKH